MNKEQQRKDSTARGADSGCMARLVRLLDSSCMGASGDDPQVIVIKQGVTGIIAGLILGVPMVLCLSWLLNTLTQSPNNA
jgi:hypothetical protein